MKVVPLNEVKNRRPHTWNCPNARGHRRHQEPARAAAVLHGVTDENLEDYLFESDPRFIARIELLWRNYQREGFSDNVRKSCAVEKV